MPRTARAIEAGLVYHVLNRGNGRMRLFHEDADLAAFERVQRIARRLGLLFTLRNAGRPVKQKENQ